MSEPIQSPEPELAKVKLGEMLRTHRLAKQTEIAELARTLILSPAQITAIESGTQSSFHNQTFYLRALKKYISYSGLEVDEQTNLLFAQIETTLLTHKAKVSPNEVSLLITAGLAHKRKSYLPHFTLRKSFYFLGGFMIVIVVGVSMLAFQKGAQTQTDQPPTVTPLAADAQTTTPAPVHLNSGEKQSTSASVSPLTALTNETPPAKSAEPTETNKPNLNTGPETIAVSLKLSFSSPSWVQAVEQNGKRIEKVFTPQDTLELDPSSLVSLVIGNARETQLHLNTQSIDLNKYLNTGSGVARFNRQELLELGKQ